jgi:hypothetical protein
MTLIYILEPSSSIHFWFYRKENEDSFCLNILSFFKLQCGQSVRLEKRREKKSTSPPNCCKSEVFEGVRVLRSLHKKKFIFLIEST